MALPMFGRAVHEDIRVSGIGNKKRSARQREALQKKVAPKVLAGVLDRVAKTQVSSNVLAPNLAKKPKPLEKAEVKQPPVQKVKATTSAPPAEPTTKAHSAVFTAEEIAAYALVRKTLNDRYHFEQNDAPVTVTVHKQTHNGSRQKNKTREYVERSVSLQNTLERLATFECVSTLIDDHNQYEARYIYSKNNITIGGVRISLGMKEELVYVPHTDTVKMAHLSLVKRSQQLQSRTPPRSKVVVKQAVVVPVTDLEDLPPWDVEDAVARGYGSLETEMDTVPAERTAYIKECQALGHNHIYHLPRGVNTSELANPYQVTRDQYMEGMANLPTGAPHYFLEKLMRECSNDDNPSPTPPTPAAMAAPTGDALDEELRKCFAALSVEWSKQVEGHFTPAHLQYMKKVHGTTYEQWTRYFTARKNRGVLTHQFYAETNKRLRQEKLGDKIVRMMAHDQAVIRSKMVKYRKKHHVFLAKKQYQMMEDLRLSREYTEQLDWKNVRDALKVMEQKNPSDPMADEARYEDWLCKDVTEDFLHSHLGRMEVQNKYNDIFSVVNHNASYRKLKAPSVQRKYSLSTAEDNVFLTPPPTGAVAATAEPVVGIVGQQNPDFLIVGETVVPFIKGMSTSAKVPVPSEKVTLASSVVSWFTLQGPLQLATG